MAENLPAYFKGKQFTSRLGAAEYELAQTLFARYYPGDTAPKNTRDFLGDLMSKLNSLPVNLQSDALSDKLSVEYWKGEAEKHEKNLIKVYEDYEKRLDDLQNMVDKLKSEQPIQIQPDKSLDYIATNPKLAWLNGYFEEGKTETLADVINAMKTAYDSTIWRITGDPLQLLDEKEYEVLKKWDAETFIPHLENLIGPETLAQYGITSLKDSLRARHKFLMFWDFVLNDPAEKILETVPNLTPELKTWLNENSFPSKNIVNQVLADIQQSATENIADAAAELDKTKENETNGARVIALHPENGAGANEPANNNGPANEGENKPE